MPGAAESNERAAHDGKEDPSFIVGFAKEQAAFCDGQEVVSPQPIDKSCAEIAHA